jgi:lipoyl(octanoyl) transferase
VRTLTVHRLGRVAYGPAHDLQKRMQRARIRDEIGDSLLLVEHPPVITLGRGAHEDHVLLSRERLGRLGFEVHEIGRGGDVTYQGPGQLVMYPIVSLEPDKKDVRRYVRDLEETMIRTCADWGLSAGRVEGLNGTWIDDRKVGAVGVRISRWVTMHGLALNVCTDLEHFDVIVPCGIRGRGVTSLSQELGRAVSLADVEDRAARHFAALFGARLRFADRVPDLPESPVDQP